MQIGTITLPGVTHGDTDFNAHQVADAERRGFPLELYVAAGVRCVRTTEDLPEGCPDYWDTTVRGQDEAGRDRAYLPGRLFQYVGPEGETEYQLCPDVPPLGKKNRPMKYVFRQGARSILNCIRLRTDQFDGKPRPLLIVEGTHQGLVAAAYAPDEFDIVGIAGCTNWRSDGLPVTDLWVTEGREVFILLDADAGANLNVYEAGEELATNARRQGALRNPAPRFIRLSDDGTKRGLDDYLLKSYKPERRMQGLHGMIIDTREAPKSEYPERPAKKKPTSRGGGDSDASLEIITDPNRPAVVMNEDRHLVIQAVEETLVQKWSGTRLFNHGGALSEFTMDAVEGGMEVAGSMRPLDLKGRFERIIMESVQALHKQVNNKGDETFTHTEPSPFVMRAVGCAAENFAAVDRVTHVPFVRADGSICTTPGYDADSRTILILDPELAGLEVPENPTDEQMQESKNFLLWWWTDVLSKMPEQSSKANAFAFLLTPFVRAIPPVKLAPLAVLDGNQEGAGKGLLLSLCHLVWLGTDPDPLAFSRDDEEIRKLVLSLFRGGAEVFAFDEADNLHGRTLRRALTSKNYTDRVLGGSVTASFINRVTWAALGNNVDIDTDIGRRAYRIRMEPPPGAANRKGSSYVFDDIEAWTLANRRDLLLHILTLIRYWVSVGRPMIESDMANFEGWQKVVGGILHSVGIEGFLEGRNQWRSEISFENVHWNAHLGWAWEQMGGEAFTTSELLKKMTAPGKKLEVLTPPDLDDLTDPGYSKKLGRAYGKEEARPRGDYVIRRAGMTRSGVQRWRIENIAALEVSQQVQGQGSEGVQGQTQQQGNPAPVPAPRDQDKTDFSNSDLGDNGQNGLSSAGSAGLCRDSFSSPNAKTVIHTSEDDHGKEYVTVLGASGPELSQQNPANPAPSFLGGENTQFTQVAERPLTTEPVQVAPGITERWIGGYKITELSRKHREVPRVSSEPTENVYSLGGLPECPEFQINPCDRIVDGVVCGTTKVLSDGHWGVCPRCFPQSVRHLDIPEV